MPDFGIDISNYQPEVTAAQFNEARRSFGISFARLGAQEPAITRQQLVQARIAEMPVDALYVTSLAQIDEAIAIARESDVPRVIVDVEEGCIETTVDLDRALALLADTGVGRGVYSRVSFWTEHGFYGMALPPDVTCWVASYFEPDASNPNPLSAASQIRQEHVRGTGLQAGLTPVECWQFHGTIELVPGLDCDLNLRFDQPVSAGSGAGVEQPVSSGGISSPAEAVETPAPTAVAFGLREEAQYGYLVMNGVDVLRFGSSELDAFGQSAYPGRLAFNRGGNWYYLRTRADGTLYQSPDEGD